MLLELLMLFLVLMLLLVLMFSCCWSCCLRCFLGFCHECLNLCVVFVFVVVVVVLNVVVVVDDDVAAVEIFNVNFFRPIHFSNACLKVFKTMTIFQFYVLLIILQPFVFQNYFSIKGFFISLIRSIGSTFFCYLFFIKIEKQQKVNLSVFLFPLHF